MKPKAAPPKFFFTFNWLTENPNDLFVDSTASSFLCYCVQHTAVRAEHTALPKVEKLEKWMLTWAFCKSLIGELFIEMIDQISVQFCFLVR